LPGKLEQFLAFHRSATIIAALVKSNAKGLSRWKQFRHRLEVLFVKFVAWIVPRLSRKSILRIALTIGWLAYRLSARERRLAHANLDIAFSDSKSYEEKARIAVASFQNFGATMLGLFWSPRLNREVLDRIVDCDAGDIELIHGLRARGKGVIFLTLHYGDWELLGLATGFYGVPLTVVMDELRNVALEEIGARAFRPPNHHAAQRRAKIAEDAQTRRVHRTARGPECAGGSGRRVVEVLRLAGVQHFGGGRAGAAYRRRHRLERRDSAA
jgi:hypothetical protein